MQTETQEAPNEYRDDARKRKAWALIENITLTHAATIAERLADYVELLVNEGWVDVLNGTYARGGINPGSAITWGLVIDFLRSMGEGQGAS